MNSKKLARSAISLISAIGISGLVLVSARAETTEILVRETHNTSCVGAVGEIGAVGKIGAVGEIVVDRMVIQETDCKPTPIVAHTSGPALNPHSKVKITHSQ